MIVKYCHCTFWRHTSARDSLCDGEFTFAKRSVTFQRNMFFPVLGTKVKWLCHLELLNTSGQAMKWDIKVGHSKWLGYLLCSTLFLAQGYDTCCTEATISLRHNSLICNECQSLSAKVLTLAKRGLSWWLSHNLYSSFKSGSLLQWI